MCIEIEAKLKVDSLEAVAERLTALGAEFSKELVQRDIYFDNADGGLVKTDRAFRLRRDLGQGYEKFSLTYKGAREKGSFKTRREIELEVSDGESAEKMLAGIGYEKVLVLEKRRQIWNFNQCEIALDELALLGSFVEIESADEGKIAEVQSQLGLSDLEHIADSYACMMVQKLNELGKDKMEAFL